MYFRQKIPKLLKHFFLNRYLYVQFLWPADDLNYSYYSLHSDKLGVSKKLPIE